MTCGGLTYAVEGEGLDEGGWRERRGKDGEGLGLEDFAVGDSDRSFRGLVVKVEEGNGVRGTD